MTDLHFIDLACKISLKGERGRPRTRPDEINADAAYDSSEIRQYLGRRGIKSNIPVNKRNSKRQGRGRPTRFDCEAYKSRSSVKEIQCMD
ncbi:MAG: hypothetical protein SVJ22_10870 [Halobacteriota archaeon]|nr:hypothetical protein [Halobacteriota archaeon]